MSQRKYYFGIALVVAIVLFLMPKPSKGQEVDTTKKYFPFITVLTTNGVDSVFYKTDIREWKLSLAIYQAEERKEELKWWKPTKNDYVVWGLFALSGAADGINQSLLHHRLGQGNSFWDASVSWKRKYKDFDGGDKSAAYFGSKSFLVWTTDGFHLTRAIDHASMYFAIGISTTNLKQYKRKDRWKVMAKRGIGSMLVRAAFFNLIYNNTGKKT